MPPCTVLGVSLPAISRFFRRMSSRALCLSADSRFNRAVSALWGSDDEGGGGLFEFENRREVDGVAKFDPEERADS